ncbi:hypothetical protein QBC36DRAFT_341150 [Triangularia setosa]|uniref:Uncharacterized protein n=1 Tax=Triangularia setosa TaxID=2587417 RepID=A0AAN6VWV8_9PEZI|nr:hypothetical protein QBC36DRAFT_341150 [Podospora setosa]
MDDILEVMPLQDRESTLLECIQIIKDTLDYLPPHLVAITAQCRDGRIQNITHLLYNHCVQYLPQASARAFFEAVCVVLEAHVDEVRFLQGRVPNNFSTYITIRSRTIALNPFFEVIKTEFLAETEWQFNSAWEKLQHEVSRVAGLQNDLIGLARDLEDGEPLNAITVLMRSYGGIDKSELNSALLSWCIAEVSAEHNQGITRCLYHASQLHLAAKELGLQGAAMARTEVVVRHIFLLCETHLKWCASSKRYGVKSCISQRHSIHPDYPFPPTVCDSYTRVATVKGTPYADGSEGNIGTTSDSRTEPQLEGSV